MNYFSITNKKDLNKLMSLAISVGETLLKNGAEAYRVEDTMNRICASRKNISYVDSFVTQTGIFLTLEFNNEIQTHFKRVRNLKNNLNVVSLVNDFSRRFVSTNLSIDDGIKQINEINNSKNYSVLTKLFFGCLASGFFSLMFGGNILDFIASFLASLLALATIEIISKLNLGFFLDNFIGGLLASLFSYLSLKFGLSNDANIVIIGSIMCLVPGVSITNSIRDTISGDSLSGLSKGMEAIFLALAIAFGVGIGLKLHMKGLI